MQYLQCITPYCIFCKCESRTSLSVCVWMNFWKLLVRLLYANKYLCEMHFFYRTLYIFYSYHAWFSYHLQHKYIVCCNSGYFTANTFYSTTAYIIYAKFLDNMTLFGQYVAPAVSTSLVAQRMFLRRPWTAKENKWCNSCTNGTNSLFYTKMGWSSSLVSHEGVYFLQAREQLKQ